jgi:hypothetical protein
MSESEASTLSAKLPDGDWLCEVKLDGYQTSVDAVNGPWGGAPCDASLGVSTAVGGSSRDEHRAPLALLHLTCIAHKS